MKTYILKCKKWNSSSLTISSEDQNVGTFLPGMFSSNYKVLLGEKEFDIRKKNVFNNNLSIYSKGELLANVKNYPFKNRSFITTADNKQYVLKSNTWNNRCQLSGENGFLGESHHKLSSTIITFDESIDDLLIASIIAQTQIEYESSTMIACFSAVLVAIIAA